jgi:hypothetical protein
MGRRAPIGLKGPAGKALNARGPGNSHFSTLQPLQSCPAFGPTPLPLRAFRLRSALVCVVQGRRSSQQSALQSLGSAEPRMPHQRGDRGLRPEVAHLRPHQPLAPIEHWRFRHRTGRPSRRGGARPDAGIPCTTRSGGPWQRRRSPASMAGRVGRSRRFLLFPPFHPFIHFAEIGV